jgi:hypothetical protein
MSQAVMNIKRGHTTYKLNNLRKTLVCIIKTDHDFFRYYGELAATLHALL